MVTKSITYADFLILGIDLGYLSNPKTKQQILKQMEIYGFEKQTITTTKDKIKYDEFQHIIKSKQALAMFCSINKMELIKKNNPATQNAKSIKIENLPNGLIPIKKQKSIIGREKEFQLMKIVLGKKYRSNLLISGAPGVGKTALVESLSEIFPIVQLDTLALISNTEYRGSFEKKIRKIINYAIEQQLILFVDEIHSLYNLGQSEGGVSALNILKPYLSTGQLSIIGATTNNELKILENDKAFTRRFVSFKLPHITIDEIKTNISSLTTEYDVKVSEEVSLEILNMIKNICNENKILDTFLDTYDTVCSAAQLQNEYSITNDNFVNYKWIVEELLHA